MTFVVFRVFGGLRADAKRVPCGVVTATDAELAGRAACARFGFGQFGVRPEHEVSDAELDYAFKIQQAPHGAEASACTSIGRT